MPKTCFAISWKTSKNHSLGLNDRPTFQTNNVREFSSRLNHILIESLQRFFCMFFYDFQVHTRLVELTDYCYLHLDKILSSRLNFWICFCQDESPSSRMCCRYIWLIFIRRTFLELDDFSCSFIFYGIESPGVRIFTRKIKISVFSMKFCLVNNITTIKELVN